MLREREREREGYAVILAVLDPVKLWGASSGNVNGLLQQLIPGVIILQRPAVSLAQEADKILTPVNLLQADPEHVALVGELVGDPGAQVNLGKGDIAFLTDLGEGGEDLLHQQFTLAEEVPEGAADEDADLLVPRIHLWNQKQRRKKK